MTNIHLIKVRNIYNNNNKTKLWTILRDGESIYVQLLIHIYQIHTQCASEISNALILKRSLTLLQKLDGQFAKFDILKSRKNSYEKREVVQG